MKTLDLFRFVPFRMNRLAAEISSALSVEYRDRYGLEIPEWRVIATLGYRDRPSTAQSVSESTHTHKSTISRAVTSLIERGIVERLENAEDRREYGLRLTRDGRKLYQSLIPRLLQREAEILDCLTSAERQQFERLLGKIEAGLSLPAEDIPAAGVKPTAGPSRDQRAPVRSQPRT
ncbi:MAG: MarR family winged helix-turn-helix transcriptional regulator [Pseudomonadota bacterium]